MGNKPSHKLSPLGDPDCEPGDIMFCEDCKVHFTVEPCTGEGTVHDKDDNGRVILVSCCPFDPMWGDYDRQYWTMTEHGDHSTVFLAIKGSPKGFLEYQKELVERFKVGQQRCDHSHDCCGCWFQSSEVREKEKDGWTVYSKSFSKNI